MLTPYAVGSTTPDLNVYECVFPPTHESIIKGLKYTLSPNMLQLFENLF